MPIGDGSSWDETNPTDATVAVQIDDYNRDLRVGVRARMANEHEWPSSQSATSQAGSHKFMTVQAQPVKPSLSGTQVGAIYIKTDNNFYFEKSSGTEVQITDGTGLNVPATPTIVTTGTSLSGAGVFQAASDGFIYIDGGAPSTEISVYVGPTNPPLVKRGRIGTGSAVTVVGGVTIPVKSLTYFSVTTNGGSLGVYEFWPIYTP